MCVLVFVAYGHMWIDGYGSWFYKACRYDCGSKTFGYYDRVYRVDPDYRCPTRFYKDDRSNYSRGYGDERIQRY